MNEVTNTQMVSRLVTTPVASAASSKGAARQQAQEAIRSTPAMQSSTGNKLPVVAEKTVEKSAEASPTGSRTIETAVASINDFVQSVHRDLHFSIDEELDRTVIKVIDSDSGDLIRQIPEEVFLELARKLNDDGELQLMNALG